ncbi:MAG TPA: hypothetical protein VFG94_03745, partial [Acidimicrobiales bacterium]|nr:hypothetical protein [Acidimicrobiales bacterium]
MTTPRDPDDMASALLDGLLTEDEAAAARRDPAVAARLAELGAVREAMGTPPASPDPGARERALAAALAAYDAGDELTDAVASVGTVGPMSGRRRAAARPAPSRAGTPSSAPGSAHGSARHRWLAAAAIVLVVVGLVGVLARNRGTGGDGSDSAAREVTTDENSTGAGGTGGAADDAEAGGGGEGTATAGEADEIVDLGDVDSSEALADRARS